MSDTIKSTFFDTLTKETGDSFNSVIKYFGGDELAAKVYRDKYENMYDKITKDSTPAKMLKRIAENIMMVEGHFNNPMTEKRVSGLLKNFKYIIPGGSILYGLNDAEGLVSLSNCFVIGREHEKDSYGAIMKRDEEMIQLMKRRGGVGMDLSFIRQHGSVVRNAAKTSTGIVPFAERYSNSIKEVAQGGRRGAGMLTLNFGHPDTLKFINAKANTDKITGANISVKIDDDTLKYVSKNFDNYVDTTAMEDANNMAFISEDASRLGNDNIYKFKTLIKNARDFSEPGILFWDRIKEQIDYSIYNGEFAPISTNPCGELPLSGDEGCRLLSMVLYNYVSNPFTQNAEFDFQKFEKDVESAQQIMDDIVSLEISYINDIIITLEDEEKYIDRKNESTVTVELELWKRIKVKAKNGRRTGLGYTALADTIAALGHRFGSNESIEIAEEITKTMMRGSYRSSIKMAKNRGCFNSYKSEEFDSDNKYIKKIKLLFYDEPDILKMWEIYGRRNIQNLAIAPTGTISILAQTSSGIEPVFNLRYTRRRRPVNIHKDQVLVVDENGEKWEEYNIVHHKFMEWARIAGETIDLSNISDKEFNKIVEKSPYYMSTAHEIDPSDKITMQGAIQQWIDSSISNTLNLHEKVTKEDVFKYALYAWETGCKGFTVYRDGSRGGILINKKNATNPFSQNDAIKRPKKLDCTVHHVTIVGNKWVVLIGNIDGKPYEVFAFKGNLQYVPSSLTYRLERVSRGHYRLITGASHVIIENINEHFDKPEEEFITRLISTSLRHGTNVKHVFSQLSKSKGYITDFQKAIARVLRTYIKDEELNIAKEMCPECNSVLVYEGGCFICNSCGYSKC